MFHAFLRVCDWRKRCANIQMLLETHQESRKLSPEPAYLPVCQLYNTFIIQTKQNSIVGFLA